MARLTALTAARTGLDAQASRRERKEGSPMTPPRRQVLDEARANFEKHGRAFAGRIPSRQARHIEDLTGIRHER